MPKQTQTKRVRAVKTPPHVDLRSLRKAVGWTIDELIRQIAIRADGATYQRGTISAIESGTRGASPKALADIAAAYRIDPDAVRTDYVPRATTKVQKATAA